MGEKERGNRQIPNGPWKSIGIFLAGFLFSALLFGVVQISRSTSKSLATLDDTDVYSDQRVREAIRKSGIELPDASWNLFYAINGFRDHGIWITFTVQGDKVWAVVEASLHKTRNDFTAGIPSEFLSHVELNNNQKPDTSIWNPENIKNPLHYSIRKKGSYFEDWVVDEVGGRIFVTISIT